MIFHSANNLRKKKEKEKEKKRKKKEKKKKKKRKKRKKKKNKRGHKRNSIDPHAITINWTIPFKHGQVLFKFNVARLVNKSDQTV